MIGLFQQVNELTYHIPIRLPILLEHGANDCARRLHVRDGEETVVIFVLRVYDYEDAVFCTGLGGGNAEEADDITSR